MLLVRVVACALLSLAIPGLAHAQSTDDEDEAKAGRTTRGAKKKAAPPTPAAAPEAAAPEAAPAEPAAEEPPMPAYDESGELAGTSENPNAPRSDFDKPEATVETKAAGKDHGPYPLERIFRPLILPKGMFEVGVDLPIAIDPGRFSGQLRGTFSAHQRVQLGLRYGTGTYTSDKYFAGKTFAVDVDVLILPWVAAQLSLPFMVDPYSQGVVLGAPMKFTFLDRFSIEILRDFVTIKAYRFAPSVIDAAFDDGQVARDELNELLSDGELNTGATFTYQFAPNLAGNAHVGQRMIDFKQDGAPTQFDLGVSYSTSTKLDVVGQTGFTDLDDATSSFFVNLAVAFRI